ncbi:MAG TPA: hypothetical protein VNZ49_14815 [Bacteroidia bacterium]|jgi:hypothetical protein|nr:hypothetical protein [Bacteroidia bacterium]
MKKILLPLLLICAVNATSFSQNCEKGCGKITKVEPTTLKGIKPDRALLIFKFQGPGGKPAKSHIKIIVDKDTIIPVLDKFGSTKITSKPGEHKLKFKANWWYTVKMNSVILTAQKTYTIFVRFEAEEIGGSKPKDDD